MGFGRLGCARDNQPYVVPIYFAYEPDHLYGFSTFGRKIEWMRANPRVCVEVEEVASHFSWVSVILNGRYQELPDTPECSSERQHAYPLLREAHALVADRSCGQAAPSEARTLSAYLLLYSLTT